MKDSAFPFWLSRVTNGVFPEAVDAQGNDLGLPNRTMVQARMAYCLVKSVELELVKDGADLLKDTIKNLLILQKKNGSFPHSFESDLKVNEERSELYTQAFILFSLGHAYSIHQLSEYELAALRLLDYLEHDRKASFNGFTEFDEKGGPHFRSNPHMHLFEGLLIWAKVGKSKRWSEWTLKIFELFQAKFIQPDGLVAEYFNSSWEVEKDRGCFLWEPGHQYEWAWLLSEMDRVLGTDTKKMQDDLFARTERNGICPNRRVVFDLMDSSGQVLKKSSRYWPQSERLKAALRTSDSKSGALAADEAMELMLGYLTTPVAGLCFDHKTESGAFSANVARASFLYHIVNAMDEYIRYR